MLRAMQESTSFYRGRAAAAHLPLAAPPGAPEMRRPPRAPHVESLILVESILRERARAEWLRVPWALPEELYCSRARAR